MRKSVRNKNLERNFLVLKHLTMNWNYCILKVNLFVSKETHQSVLSIIHRSRNIFVKVYPKPMFNTFIGDPSMLDCLGEK